MISYSNNKKSKVDQRIEELIIYKLQEIYEIDYIINVETLHNHVSRTDDSDLMSYLDRKMKVDLLCVKNNKINEIGMRMSSSLFFRTFRHYKDPMTDTGPQVVEFDIYKENPDKKIIFIKTSDKINYEIYRIRVGDYISYVESKIMTTPKIYETKGSSRNVTQLVYIDDKFFRQNSKFLFKLNFEYLKQYNKSEYVKKQDKIIKDYEKEFKRKQEITDLEIMIKLEKNETRKNNLKERLKKQQYSTNLLKGSTPIVVSYDIKNDKINIC